MIGARIEISAVLEVLSPLHVGSGQSKSAADGEGTLALVQTDVDGNPCLPGSSIKGVLREMFGRPSPLFGYEPDAGSEDADSDAPDNENAGARAGHAIFWTAKVEPGGAKLAVEHRTAIDAAAGVAQRARLFQAQVVPVGTRFRLDIALQDGRNQAATDLAQVLKTLMVPEAVAFGRNTRQGYGRLRLDRKTLAARRICPVDGLSDEGAAWRHAIDQAPYLPRPGQTIPLRLTCDGPFAVLDHAGKDQDEDGVQLRALGDPDARLPRIPGASLAGALRARFAWFMANRPGGDGDDKDKAFTNLADLTVSERLFGVTGWRGRVGIAPAANVTAAAVDALTSVKLDRFSGAPIDNALFTTQVYSRVTADLDLTLDNSRGDADAKVLFAEDDKVFADFIKDLTDPVWGGLDLGHGSNKGFGWFTVERRS